MTTTTDAYWDVDGTILNTFAFNIEELDGLEGMALPVQGGNLLVPNRPGELFLPHTHAPTTRTMKMWVSYKDANGGIASTRELRWGQFQTNLDTLRAAIGDPRTERVITKRVFKADGTLTTRFFKGIATNVAELSYVENDYWPSAEFELEFTCADPYWYGPLVSLTNIGGTVITNPGTMYARKMTLAFQGGTGPTLTNSSMAVVCTVSGAVGSGVLDTDLFTAIDGGTTNIIGRVSHTGAREFMLLKPGTNTMAVTGGGTVDLAYNPVYL